MTWRSCQVCLRPAVLSHFLLPFLLFILLQTHWSAQAFRSTFISGLCACYSFFFFLQMSVPWIFQTRFIKFFLDNSLQISFSTHHIWYPLCLSVFLCWLYFIRYSVSVFSLKGAGRSFLHTFYLRDVEWYQQRVDSYFMSELKRIQNEKECREKWAEGMWAFLRDLNLRAEVLVASGARANVLLACSSLSSPQLSVRVLGLHCF